jgi:hypothetical protein
MSLIDYLMTFWLIRDDETKVEAIYRIEGCCPNEDEFLEVLRSVPIRIWLK